MKKITLVAPFYNEESGVFDFLKRVDDVAARISSKYEFEILCVNDGSKDKTLEKMISYKKDREDIKILDLSRNFGKEAALTAGLDFASGDIIIPIDSDLQHPPEVILSMLEKWEEGFEVVLAKRSNRKTDGVLYGKTATLFYRLSKNITHVEIPRDVGDFRLMDRKVVEALGSMRESCRFMKGVFAWVGFKTAMVEYDVEPRSQGRSSFNPWRLWNFALDGITNFSTIPLRVWSYLGGGISFFAFCYAVYLVLKTVLFGAEVPGFATLMTTLLVLSGVQLIGIGVLGEYLGRIFMEVKNRPVYIVRETY